MPFEPTETTDFHEDDVDGFFFNFGSALDSSIHRGARCTILRQGYALPGINARLESKLLKPGAVCIQDFPESFCVLLICPNKVIAYSSQTGVDQLFFYSTENATYVTNRHNLIGAVVRSLTFKKSSFAWMAGRTHIGDMSTYWNEIARSKPGEKYIITADSISSFDADSRNLFDPIPNSDIRSEVAGISEYFQDILSNVSAEKRLWLSGGKDSRAIFGLIDCDRVRAELELTTGGELYAPDVMAAQGLSALVGMSAKHKISRPAITSSKIIIAEKIANDLTVDFTGGSLADLRPISKSSNCIIGGHENGFKTKKNTKSLDEYVAERVYWVDNLNILTSSSKDELYAGYKQELIRILAGVPVSRFGQVDLVNNRNPNFLSSTITASHISSSEIHPFLDGRMYRLLCGVSDEALDSQFIHYTMMYNSPYALESLPFAADNWPESLYDIAEANNLPLRNGRSSPYKFNKLFPTLKSFGLFDWRLNLVEGSQKFVREYVNDNSQFFDFLNMETFNDLVSKGSRDFAFKEIYTFLSILKASFVHHFNEKLFDFSKRSEIAEEVNRLLDFEKLAGKPDAPRQTQLENENAFLKNKLEDYERSIAQIVKQHKDEDEANGGDGAASEEAVIAAMHKDAFATAEFSPILHRVLLALGYQILPKEGVEILDDSLDLSQAYVCSADLFMDESEHNKVLVSVESSDGHQPDWFNKSEAGFYFKYLANKSGYGLAQSSLSYKGLSGSSKVIVKIKPWYSKKPIYFKSARIDKA